MAIPNNRPEKDLISLLFVGDEKKDAQKPLFSKANGFIAQVCSSVKQGVLQAEKTLPDIVLMDAASLVKVVSLGEAELSSLEKWIGLFDQIHFRFKPAFFLGVDAYPDVDLRMTLHGFGFDEFLVRPLSVQRSDGHTSELQSHSEISYAVFCWKKKNKKKKQQKSNVN